MKNAMTRAFVSLSLFFATTAAQAQRTYPDHPHFWGHDWGWGYMIFGSLMMIILVAGAIVVVVLVIRWLGASSQGAAAPRHAPPGKTPLDILKERFARGEIDTEEFEERRRILGE